MGYLFREKTDEQRADAIAVSSFFHNYKKANPSSLTSGWRGIDQEFVTLKDIILHAMKKPTDINGNGGNLTAHILFKHYGICVERNHKHPSCEAPLENGDFKKNFYDAWYKVRESETDALNNYYLLRNEQKEKEAKGYFPTWRRSQVAELVKNTDEVKSQAPVIAETKRSLVSLVKASRPGFFRRILAGLRCPTFFYGSRTHLIFNTPRTTYKNTNEITIFGIDTRKARSSEDAAKKIIDSTTVKGLSR